MCDDINAWRRPVNNIETMAQRRVGGSDWWGPQRFITLALKDHRPFVAVVNVIE